MKRTFGIATVLLLGLGLLASCGAKNESQEQSHFAKSKVSSTTSKTTSDSSSTKKSSSLTQTTQPSSKVSASTTSTTSAATVSSSTNESTSLSQLTPSSSSASTPSTSNMPYEVNLASTNFPLTFYYDGFNVPDSVSINDSSMSSVTFLSENGESTTYKTDEVTVPTKQIRIFSVHNHSNQIRTVKVNTQINLIQNQTNSISIKGPLYLFYNNQGGISLITPNYAGNVPDNERDVMLEVLQ